jgi:hypothetical protein
MSACIIARTCDKGKAKIKIIVNEKAKVMEQIQLI